MRRKLIVSSLSLIAFLLLSLLFLFKTQAGLQSVVFVVHKLMPDLQLASAEGHLGDSLLIKGLNYQPQQGSTLRIDKISLNWSPAKLLKAELLVNKLHIDNVAIDTRNSAAQTDEEEAGGFPDIALPIEVSVRDFSLKTVTLKTTESEQVLLNQLQTDVHSQHSTVHINQLTFHSQQADLSLTAQLDLMAPHSLNGDYQVTLKQLIDKDFVVQGQFEGDFKQLNIKQQLIAPFTSEQNIQLTQLLTDLHWQLSANADTVNLADIIAEQKAQLSHINISARGDLQSMQSEHSLSLTLPDLPQINIKQSATGHNWTKWQTRTQLLMTKESRISMQADIDLAETSPIFDITANWQDLNWPLTDDNALIQQLSGQLQTTGNIEEYTFKTSSNLLIKNDNVDVKIAGKGNKTAIDIEQLQALLYGGEITAQTHIDLTRSLPDFALQARWQGLHLPEWMATQKIVLNSGELTATNQAEQLQLSNQAETLIGDITLNSTLSGHGNIAKGLDSIALKLAQSSGQLTYAGNVFWADAIDAAGRLSLDKFDPAFIAADWPGQLSGDMAITMTALQSADAAAVEVDKINISGQLRDKAVVATGSARYQSGQTTINALNIQSGQSRLSANGKISNEMIALDWHIDSPDLNDFYPDSAGRLQAMGQLQGTLSAPSLTADIQADKLMFADVSLAKLSSQLSMQLTDNGEIQSQTSLTALQLPAFTADTITLNTTGKLSNHTLTLALASQPLNLDIQATGAYQHNRWQGQLQQFDIANKQAGKWVLSKQQPIQLSAQSQLMPEHCWSAQAGKFCLDAQHQQDNSWLAAGEFNAVPLTLFEVASKALNQVQGVLQGKFSIQADAEQNIQGQGHIKLVDASVKLEQLQLAQDKALALNDTQLVFQLDQQGSSLQFQTHPQLEGMSVLSADIRSDGVNQMLAAPDNAQLQGKLHASLADLSALHLSHPAFSDLKGKLDLNVDIAGRIAEPELSAQLNLDKGAVFITDAGINLREIQALVKGDLASGFDFDYHAKSGEGKLDGSGRFNLAEQGWQLDTVLKGTQLTLLNTPEAFVIAEPDLTVSLTPQKTLVKGLVKIPQAELQPRTFNSQIAVSKDVVVINHSDDNKQSGVQTELDLKVVLGDKVKLKALGFQGRLQGPLQVTGNTGDLLKGTGEIKVLEGSYVAYGQLLSIDDGRIIFSGGAVEDPELDIKAVRKGKTVTAGLQISGQASSPQATLFSDPVMGQDDILSYILLGKPIEQASATDAALLASAATGMGVQNGAMLGDQIASTFGLDEFSVRGDSAENAAVYVGKYLSPKLYLSYGMGVFDAVSTVELRYQLSKIWTLKAESGTESGVDFLYTYER